MLKTALNKNIIPHTWKLANIVPIPKPNKDTDNGTSCMPISILSVIAKTLEKSLLPYITSNIPNTPKQHGYKTQHSTVTALHTTNNTVAKGFNQKVLHARTITVAKPTQHIEITHHHNINLKLAVHKVASFQQHYSTYTLPKYHHPLHLFRSWAIQTTSQSHLHTQAQVQPKNTYNHTYIKLLPGQNKTASY